MEICWLVMVLVMSGNIVFVSMYMVNFMSSMLFVSSFVLCDMSGVVGVVSVVRWLVCYTSSRMMVMSIILRNISSIGLIVDWVNECTLVMMFEWVRKVLM